MTEGHKHRTVRIKSFDARWVRRLRKPLRHVDTSDPDGLDLVEWSRYPYGPCPEHRQCYVLTPLGILHRWFGLVLSNEPKRP